MILSLALQVEHVLLFEFRVFSFGKICFILSLTQKNIAVVKRGDKPHIYQIAPVGLEKAVYRQQTAPVLHRAGRGKGTVRGVDVTIWSWASRKIISDTATLKKPSSVVSTRTVWLVRL